MAEHPKQAPFSRAVSSSANGRGCGGAASGPAPLQQVRAGAIPTPRPPWWPWPPERLANAPTHPHAVWGRTHRDELNAIKDKLCAGRKEPLPYPEGLDLSEFRCGHGRIGGGVSFSCVCGGFLQCQEGRRHTERQARPPCRPRLAPTELRFARWSAGALCRAQISVLLPALGAARPPPADAPSPCAAFVWAPPGRALSMHLLPPTFPKPGAPTCSAAGKSI